MIELLQDWDVISWTEIENGVERKRNKLKQWSKLIDPYPPKPEQTSNEQQKMVYAHTPPYSSVNMTPLTPEEEREWDRIYQNQVKESQKNAKESQ